MVSGKGDGKKKGGGGGKGSKARRRTRSRSASPSSSSSGSSKSRRRGSPALTDDTEVSDLASVSDGRWEMQPAARKKAAAAKHARLISITPEGVDRLKVLKALFANEAVRQVRPEVILTLTKTSLGSSK